MRLTTQPTLRGVTALAVVVSAVLSGCQWGASSQESSLRQAPLRTVYALGRLEPATGVIDIRATPGDQVKELRNITENELAPADGILGLLSSYDMGKAQLTALIKKRDLAVQKHRQQIQVAEAQLAQAMASKAQAEAEQTKLGLQLGKLEALRIASELAESEYQQLEQLRASDPELVTRHQLEKRKNQMDLASQDYLIARDSHASAMEAAELVVQAAIAHIAVAETTKQQAAKNYEKLIIDQEIEVAREALKRSVLLAPNASTAALRAVLGDPVAKAEDHQADGEGPEEASRYTVLKVFLRDGEVVTQGPILQLGDLSQMVCIAEVYEADVKELWEGQPVTIRSPAFSGRFADGKIDPKTNRRSGGIKGHVVRIGRIIEPPGLSSRNPLAPADRSVVEVRIEIDSAQESARSTSETSEEPTVDRKVETPVEHASRNVGLQVTVEFESKKQETESGGPEA